MKGKCSDPACRYWHSPVCRDWKKGNCTKAKCEFLHGEKPKGNAAVQSDQAQLKTARFSFKENLKGDNPCDDLKISTGKSSAFLYILRTPKFSAEDVQKSARDEKTPLLQQRLGANYKPKRTDSDGNVVFPDDIENENERERGFREALKLRKELEPDTDEHSFFLKGSEVRKVYSFRPDPAFLTVLSKSQKRKQRKLARSKTHFSGRRVAD